MEDLSAYLQQAKRQNASDVYLLPKAGEYLLALRIAGRLQGQRRLPVAVGARWINYLKYQAGMNVAEHRRVQGGALYDAALGLHMRLSSVGNFAGQEALVVRLIQGIPPLDEWSTRSVAQLEQTLKVKGMLALCGPTGSGKTTLLYQLAQKLAQNQLVMTIEDPVEISHPEFLQLQVNPEADMTYLALLKAALRQRPDILLIGEIRDRETAITACEAAISGHVVLTTVHARRASLVPLRLTSLAVPEALVKAALVASAEVQLIYQPKVHAEVLIQAF